MATNDATSADSRAPANPDASFDDRTGVNGDIVPKARFA
jgi:hypothetical protein